MSFWLQPGPWGLPRKPDFTPHHVAFHAIPEVVDGSEQRLVVRAEGQADPPHQFGSQPAELSSFRKEEAEKICEGA